MRYMLKAMCYGSDQALQRFPRLLQIVEMYPDTDTVQAFITKVSVFVSLFNIDSESKIYGDRI